MQQQQQQQQAEVLLNRIVQNMHITHACRRDVEITNQHTTTQSRDACLLSGLLHFLCVYALSWLAAGSTGQGALAQHNMSTILLLQLTATAALTSVAAAVWLLLYVYNSWTTTANIISSSSSSKGRAHHQQIAEPTSSGEHTCCVLWQVESSKHVASAAVTAGALRDTASLSGVSQQQQQKQQQQQQQQQSETACHDSAAAAAVHQRTSRPSAPIVDVWILAGQSNMVGWNKADGQPMPELCAPWPGEMFAFNSKGRPQHDELVAMLRHGSYYDTSHTNNSACYIRYAIQ
jgi:hypothetical protein